MSVTSNIPAIAGRLRLFAAILHAPFSGETNYLGNRAAEVLQASLQAAAPKRTGAYAAAIQAMALFASDELVVTADAPEPLTTWITEGTRAHPIDPVSALALFWPGAAHPVRHVDHPGTYPNQFYVGAMQATETQLATELPAALVRRFLSGW